MALDKRLVDMMEKWRAGQVSTEDVVKELTKNDAKQTEKLVKETKSALNNRPHLFLDNFDKELQQIAQIKEEVEETGKAAEKAKDKLQKTYGTTVEGAEKKLDQLKKDIEGAIQNFSDIQKEANDKLKELKKEAYASATGSTNPTDKTKTVNKLIKEFESLRQNFKDGVVDLTGLNDGLQKLSADYNVNLNLLDEYNDKLDQSETEQTYLNDKVSEEVNLRKGLNDYHTNNLASIKAQNKEAANGISMVKSGFSSIKKGVLDIANAWGKIDQAAAKSAKSIGSSAINLASMRKNAMEAVAKGAFSSRFGVDGVKLLELQSGYQNTIGRRVSLSASDQESMAALNPIMGEQGAEMAARLENFGLSYTDAGKTATKMFKEAGKYGLSFEKYSQNFVKNLHIAQNYTFKNGLKGLESMAKKSTAIKLDMQQIASFADKVSTVEGAVETGAALQVLGGPFASMADPLGMLNEGLNDIEGLMDRFQGMVGGLGKFDAATGEISVSSFNKQRIKAAASAMGMDYSQVMESVQAQGRQKYIEEKIANKGYSTKQQEFLRNTATVSGGRVEVSWLDAAGERHTKDASTETITPEEWKMIEAQNQTEGDNIADIASMLRGWDDVITGGKGQIENKLAQFGEKLGMSGVKDMHKNMFDNDGTVSMIAIAKTGFKTIGGLLKMGLGILSTISGGVWSIFGKMGGFKSLGKMFKGVSGKAGKWVNGTKLGKWAAGTKFGGKMASAGTKVGGKVFKKTGSKFLGRLAGATVKGGGVGTVASIGGVVGDMLIDNAIGKGKMKRGGLGNYLSRIAAGAAGGAGGGAALGAAAGGVTALPAAIIGGVFGALNGLRKGIADDIVGDAATKSGTKVQGTYGVIRAHKIKKALETGEMSERLQNKLIRNGETDLLEKISEVKSQKIGQQNIDRVNASAIYVDGERLVGNGNARAANGGIVTGPSHSNGGVPVGHTGIEVEGGEFVVNKKATKNNMGLLTAINKMGNGGVIKPRKMENGGTLSVAPTSPSASVGAGVDSKGISVDPININITGKITLDGGNGKSADISEILKDPNVIRSLTKLIEEQIGQNLKGGNITQKGLR